MVWLLEELFYWGFWGGLYVLYLSGVFVMFGRFCLLLKRVLWKGLYELFVSYGWPVFLSKVVSTWITMLVLGYGYVGVFVLLLLPVDVEAFFWPKVTVRFLGDPWDWELKRDVSRYVRDVCRSEDYGRLRRSGGVVRSPHGDLFFEPKRVLGVNYVTVVILGCAVVGGVALVLRFWG